MLVTAREHLSSFKNAKTDSQRRCSACYHSNSSSAARRAHHLLRLPTLPGLSSPA